MSSMVKRIQKGAGNFAGLLTSYRKRWGTQLGVRNEKATDLVARQAREAKRTKGKTNG